VYEIFRATDGLYIANSGQLILKIMLNDLFMAEKLCNLLNAAQQSVNADVMPCGHPLAESYQGEDGGKYCRICESA